MRISPFLVSLKNLSVPRMITPMKALRDPRIFLAIATIFFLIILTTVYLYRNPYITDAATQIVATCQNVEKSNECYEEEVPRLFGNFSIPELFEMVRIIRRLDPQYQFCHVLAHKLGERAVEDDPAHWIDVMPLNPSDGMCSNGFLHGVIGGRFRAEVLDEATIETLVPDFRRACEPTKKWHPSPLDQAICYHGMGHLYVYITDAQLRDALDLCEKTTYSGHPEADYRQVCREGVFMQIYQPLEPDDFAMIERMEVKPKKETIRTFCAQYRDVPEYEGACLRESWPFFREEISDGSGVQKFCAKQPNSTEEKNCYQSATAIIGRMSLGDVEKSSRACNALVDSWRLLCFINVATSIIEENRNDSAKAVAQCQKAGAHQAEECIKTLASRARWFFGTDARQHQQFCSVFPAEYHSVCIR